MQNNPCLNDSLLTIKHIPDFCRQSKNAGGSFHLPQNVPRHITVLKRGCVSSHFLWRAVRIPVARFCITGRTFYDQKKNGLQRVRIFYFILLQYIPEQSEALHRELLRRLRRGQYYETGRRTYNPKPYPLSDGLQKFPFRFQNLHPEIPGDGCPPPDTE